MEVGPIYSDRRGGLSVNLDTKDWALVVAGILLIGEMTAYRLQRRSRDRCWAMVAADRAAFDRAIAEERKSCEPFVIRRLQGTLEIERGHLKVELPPNCQDADGITRNQILWLLEDGGARCEPKRGDWIRPANSGETL